MREGDGDGRGLIRYRFVVICGDRWLEVLVRVRVRFRVRVPPAVETRSGAARQAIMYSCRVTLWPDRLVAAAAAE